MISASTESPPEDSALRERVLSTAAGFVPSFVRRRYAAKLAVVLVFVILLVSLLGAVSFVETRTIVERDAKQQIRSTGLSYSGSTSEWVVSMRVQTRLISSNQQLASAESTAARRRALDRAITDSTGPVRHLYYINTTTNVVEASSSSSSGVTEFEGRTLSELDQPLGRSIERTQRYSGVPSLVAQSDRSYRLDQERVIAFVSTVPETDGVLVLVGSVEDKIAEFNDTRASTSTVILNADGDPVFRPDRTDRIGTTDREAFRNATNGSTSLVETDSAVQVYAPVSSVNWVVITSADRSELFAVSRAVGENVLLTVLATIVVLGVAGTLLGRQIVGPLRDLRDTAEAISEGNLDVNVARSRRVDEIGELQDSFHEMQQYLTTVADQAEALARQEFEDEALDEPVPGTFGDALDEMRRNIEGLIIDLEASNADLRETNSELKKRNEQFEFFNSLLRHDVLNGLMIIRSRAELLRERTDDETVEERMATIIERSDALAEKTDRVREILAALAGEEREFEPRSVSAILDEQLERIEAIHDVEVSPTSRDAEVLADDLLADVFDNLVTNAVKHNDTEGLRIDASVHHDGSEVEVRIADNGRGIDDGDKEAIFKRDEIGHAKDIGSGFGLYFVDTMVDRYGGDIRVEDNEPRGAVFVLRLPAAT